MSKPFISKAEAAKRMGTSRFAVYSMIWRGIIPTDSEERIPREPFMKWLAARTGEFTDGK